MALPADDDDDRLSIRMGPVWPLFAAFMREAYEGQLARPKKATLVKECLEIGLRDKMAKLSKEKQEKIERAAGLKKRVTA